LLSTLYKHLSVLGRHTMGDFGAEFLVLHHENFEFLEKKMYHNKYRFPEAMKITWISSKQRSNSMDRTIILDAPKY
jgi:hypothetical protein